MKTLINTGSGAFFFTGKNHGFDLYEVKHVEVKEDGNPTGEFKDKEVWVGFYPNIQLLANKLVTLEMQRSDAETLEELLSTVKQVASFITLAIEEECK